MTIKSLMITGVLAVASLSIASAKSYDIVLSNTTKVANVQLKAGQYTLKVQGNNAVFTDQDSGKKYTAPATLQTASSKFDQTAVDSQKKDGVDQVQAIELGGTNTKLEFNATE